MSVPGIANTLVWLAVIIIVIIVIFVLLKFLLGVLFVVPVDHTMMPLFTSPILSL